MTKEKYIQLLPKQDNSILVVNLTQVDRDGDKIYQFVAHGTVSAFLSNGWVLSSTVATPPEALEVMNANKQSDIQEVTKPEPLKRGRKAKTNK